MYRFSQSPISRRASAPFQNIPMQQPQPGMPMQMAMPALPPMVQGQKAQPSVYQGINGLLDMQETKDGAAWLKGLFPSQEEQQASEFDGLTGLMGKMIPALMPGMSAPVPDGWSMGGSDFNNLGGLLGSWF